MKAVKKIKRFFKYLFNYRKNSGISFKESLNLGSLPVIMVECIDLSNKKFKANFLLDTGADFNMINTSFVTKNKMKLNIIGIIEGLTTATDVQPDNNADIYEMYLLLNDETIKSEFASRDMDCIFDQFKSESGIQIHGILSSKFFNEHKYILDYECYKMYQ